MDEAQTTKKVKVAHKLNELEYARYKYNEALTAMLVQPTKENAKAFDEASKNLIAVEVLYHTAARLLFERARRFKNALFGIEDFV